MKRLSKDEIDAILVEHNKWLADEKTGRRAEFTGCEFIGFVFPRGCTVIDCTVSGCTVSGCTVSGCKVSGGTVSGCKVSDCKVSGGTVSGCTVSDCKVSYCKVSYCTVSGGTVSGCKVSGGTVSGCKVSDCKVSGGTVSGGTVSGMPLAILKGYSGLYRYNVWAVLFVDGSRWVRMGCLFKSLEDWEKNGIRNSNLSEFPDDGSDVSEERVTAFEFAKAAALRLKAAPHA